jgi:hypothetical protein
VRAGVWPPQWCTLLHTPRHQPSLPCDLVRLLQWDCMGGLPSANASNIIWTISLWFTQIALHTCCSSFPFTVNEAFTQSWAQLPLSVGKSVVRWSVDQWNRHIFHFENVCLTEERLFLNLNKASVLKIQFCRIF